MKKIKILIADDHKIVIDGIKSLLTEEEDLIVVGEVDNGKQVLDFVETNEVDVFLVDVTMPVMNGIETAQALKEKYPSSKILALTMHEDPQYFKRMIEAGASGYILKNTDKHELVKAIRLIAEGRNYFSNEMYSDYIMGRIKPEKKTEEPDMFLTKREIEVLKLIAEEMKNHEIAEKLFISTRTVDTHRRNLLQKLDVKNTAGLVRYAIKSGIVE